MKMVKIIVAFILASISFSSQAVAYGAPATTCAIQVRTDKMVRFYNVNAIRYVGMSNNNRKVVVINTIGSNKKEDNINIYYEREGDALFALYDMAISIDECNMEKKANSHDDQ